MTDEPRDAHDADAADTGADGGESPGAASSERPPLGLDQLQAAGQELIGAMRAVLDVAEDLLSDPRTADAVGSALSSIERAATRAAATGRRATSGWTAGDDRAGGQDHDEDDDQGPGVQHIPVS